MYNMGSAVEVLTGAAPLDAAPGLRAELEQATHALWLYLLYYDCTCSYYEV